MAVPSNRPFLNETSNLGLLQLCISRLIDSHGMTSLEWVGNREMTRLHMAGMCGKCTDGKTRS